MPTTEKMNEQTSQVLGNQFFGEFESDQERQKKECAIIGLMKNQIIVLEEQLNDSLH